MITVSSFQGFLVIGFVKIRPPGRRECSFWASSVSRGGTRSVISRIPAFVFISFVTFRTIALRTNTDPLFQSTPPLEGDQLARPESRPEGELQQAPEGSLRSEENDTHLLGREGIRRTGLKGQVLDPVHRVPVDDPAIEGIAQCALQMNENVVDALSYG